jgi:outer membrane protein assembly factor BamA
MIAVAATRFHERGGSDFTFDRVAGDARGYASLGSPQRVLALRALASVDRPAAGSRVPFYLQEALGGSRTLRGYHSFRFRGEKLLLLQAEYRWETWPALEFALFADVGRAYGRNEAFALRGLEHDYGVGVRLKTHDSVLARLEVARSGEDTRLLLRLGPSF